MNVLEGKAYFFITPPCLCPVLLPVLSGRKLKDSPFLIMIQGIIFSF